MVKSSLSSKGAKRSIPVADVPDHILDQKVKDQATAAVLETTSAHYAKKIFTMRQWLLARRKPDSPITDADLSRFLADRNVTNGNTAKNWRSAARKWRTLEKVAEQDTAATALLDTQIRGISYQAGKAQTVAADVIDSGRLGDMTRLLLKWGYTEYALHFVFVFYTMFRKMRGGNVLVSDVRFDTDIGTTIASKRAKFASSVRVEPGAIGNFKEVHNLTTFLKDLVKGKEPNDRLFPSYVEKTANDIIKRCAEKLKWGEGKWCVLSLRHGSSREGQAVLEDEPDLSTLQQKRIDAKTSKRMGHRSLRSKKTYQKSRGSNSLKINARNAIAGLF